MVGLGAGLRPGRRRVGGSSGLGNDLDFSALSALPVGRQSAVTTAANAAATTLGVSAQSIIDALAVGRGLASLLPNDGCNLASSGGAVTSQGDPVGAIQTWTGVELAVQPNASLQPVSGADGLVGDGAELMSLGDLSAWAEGEGLAVITPVFSNTPGTHGLWSIGSSDIGSAIFASDGRALDDFGATLRAALIIIPTSSTTGMYGVRCTSDGVRTASWNVTDGSAQTSLTVAFSSNATLFASIDRYFVGTILAFALNSNLYTTDQRAAVREFCKEYFGVVY